MKIIKKILLLLLVFISTIGMTSCKDKKIINKPFVNGDFIFDLLEEKDELTIIGLSEEGKTKETLVLPTIVNGKKVTTLGYVYIYPITNGREERIDFEGASFKNFYVHSLIEKCDYNVGSLIRKPVYKANYYYPKVPKPTAKGLWCDNLDQGYTTERAKREKLEKNPGATWPKYYKSVNVIYYMNDGTDDAFFVDDCDDSKVNVIPPEPYRDGYTFMGWYKEKECINKFDFENEIIPEKEYDEEGNYILKENNIYARWEVLK